MNLRPLLLSALVVPIAAAPFSELAATDEGGGCSFRAGGRGAARTSAPRCIGSQAKGWSCPPVDEWLLRVLGSLKGVEFKFQRISLGDINTATTGRFAVSRNGRYLVDASWNGRIIEIATK